jgi:2-hydroxy-3-oxopropionate reductase
MSEKPRIGFIGLGGMGLPMAERVLAAGFDLVTTFHTRREPADHLASKGARILGSPEEIAREADVVITIVPADRELMEVATGPRGLIHGLTQGKLLIEMTTALPATVRDLERALAPAGVAVLDAPVSGGVAGAVNGTLTIMAGGEKTVLDQCHPLLKAMGSKIVHVGGVGQGKVVKMVNQMMAAVHILTVGEAFALGVRCGADPATLYEVIKDSSGSSRMMEARMPMLRSGAFDPGFKLDLMKKDVNLALDSARSEGVPMLLGSVAGQILSAASAAGNGGADFAIAAQFLADLAGVRLSAPPTEEARR